MVEEQIEFSTHRLTKARVNVSAVMCLKGTDSGHRVKRSTHFNDKNILRNQNEHCRNERQTLRRKVNDISHVHPSYISWSSHMSLPTLTRLYSH